MFLGMKPSLPRGTSRPWASESSNSPNTELPCRNIWRRRERQYTCFLPFFTHYQSITNLFPLSPVHLLGYQGDFKMIHWDNGINGDLMGYFSGIDPPVKRGKLEDSRTQPRFLWKHIYTYLETMDVPWSCLIARGYLTSRIASLRNWEFEAKFDSSQTLWFLIFVRLAAGVSQKRRETLEETPMVNSQGFRRFFP